MLCHARDEGEGEGEEVFEPKEQGGEEVGDQEGEGVVVLLFLLYR